MNYHNSFLNVARKNPIWKPQNILIWTEPYLIASALKLLWILMSFYIEACKGTTIYIEQAGKSWDGFDVRKLQIKTIISRRMVEIKCFLWNHVFVKIYDSDF